MKKPRLKSRKSYDYNECAEYIAHKLGVKDIRDFAGRWNGDKFNESKPYQDFWHFLYNHCEIHNGGEMYMPCLDDLNLIEDWQYKILQAFQDEFGEDAVYWVEW
jgi:hypothetical protein